MEATIGSRSEGFRTGRTVERLIRGVAELVTVTSVL